MQFLGGILLIGISVALTGWRIRDYQDNFLRALGEDLLDTVVGISWPVAILAIFVLGVGLVAL